MFEKEERLFTKDRRFAVTHLNKLSVQVVLEKAHLFLGCCDQSNGGCLISLYAIEILSKNFTFSIRESIALYVGFFLLFGFNFIKGLSDVISKNTLHQLF